MTIGAVGFKPQMPRMSKKASQDYTKGAIYTGTFLTSSAGLSWATKTSKMKEVVQEYGGKKQYAKAFGKGLFVLSIAGAVVNTVLNFIADKVPENKNPKAV